MDTPADTPAHSPVPRPKSGVPAGGKRGTGRGNAEVLAKLEALYTEAFAHDGFAEIRVEIRILRRGQKEVILHCGKQYRYVVDYLPAWTED
jgi:hypothetical protein